MSSSNLGEEQKSPDTTYPPTEEGNVDWPKTDVWNRDGQRADKTTAEPPEVIYPAGDAAGYGEVHGPS